MASDWLARTSLSPTQSRATTVPAQSALSLTSTYGHASPFGSSRAALLAKTPVGVAVEHHSGAANPALPLNDSLAAHNSLAPHASLAAHGPDFTGESGAVQAEQGDGHHGKAFHVFESPQLFFAKGSLASCSQREFRGRSKFAQKGELLRP
jgi:hypothetical protein